jgi:SAM-dependent methyltransferase
MECFNAKAFLCWDIMMALKDQSTACWVCGSTGLTLAKEGDVDSTLNSKNFEITDKNYGVTFSIYRCPECNFLQCSEADNILEFYTHMVDNGYELTRGQRSIQAKKIVSSMAKLLPPPARHLDVGAGSGILVQQSVSAGYQTVGIEPSIDLHKKAIAHDLHIINGVLPSDEVGDCYNIVTLIDIIEHVTDPLSLLLNVRDVMADDALLFLDTPDVRSVAATIMGRKWWHYRIAHVGYFDENTLTKLIDHAGLEIISITRPTWYFPINYLVERVVSYFPNWLRFRVPSFIGDITVPLNLFDSMRVVCRKKRVG